MATLDDVCESMGLPFLYHLIRGEGVPRAWQGSVATECKGNVWFVGPTSIRGGGTSSTEVTWNIEYN